MQEIVRDSFFGATVYHLSGRRFFRHAEDLPDFVVPPHLLREDEKRPDPSRESSRTLIDEERSDRPGDESRSDQADRSADNAKAEVGAETSKSNGIEHKRNIVGWYSASDAANPQNWPPWRKHYTAAQICLLTTTIYMGSSIVSPGTMLLAEKLGISTVAATLDLSLFVAGYGAGALVLAPASEIPAIGRNPPYIITLALFVVLQIPIALATNLGTLLPLRFITGVLGSPCLATGGDMYAPHKATNALAVWGIAAVAGPSIGPVLGGWTAMKMGVEWPIWVLMMGTAASLVLLTFTLPETSSDRILYWRAHRLIRRTGNTELKSESMIKQAEMTPGKIAYMSLVLPFKMTIAEPICIAFNLYIAFVYGLLYIWLESFAVVFEMSYGFNTGLLGTAFLALFIGAVGGALPTILLWSRYRYEPLVKRMGGMENVKPEVRMELAMLASFLMPIGLFGFGATAQYPDRVHWIAPLIFAAIFAWGLNALFNAVLSYLGEVYPSRVASVFASNDFLRAMFGAGFPLFATATYERLGTLGASFLLGGLAVCFIPIPFVLSRYGERIRKASKLTG